MTIELKLPAMGEGVIEATIATWLKAEGDVVKQFEPLVEVETDKVTTEVVAESDGVLLKIVASAGETIAVEQTLALIGASGDPIPTAVKQNGAANSATQVVATAPAPASIPAPQSSSTTTRISPVVARMVKTHALDLTRINGTGKAGRVTKRDVQAHLKQLEQTAPIPKPRVNGTISAELTPPNASFAIQNSSLLPHTPMRRRIAEHMVLSKATSPHATTVHEIDYSAVKAHRAAHKDEYAARGVKLTYMAYLAMAVVKGLQTVPHANSSWHDDGLAVHPAIHLGIAAAVDDGLVVPVVKQADTLNLLGMAQAIGSLAERARGKQLTAADMQGGTFTITNHGVFGSLFATPIIN